jgi:hypothetical protein
LTRFNGSGETYVISVSSQFGMFIAMIQSVCLRLAVTKAALEPHAPATAMRYGIPSTIRTVRGNLNILTPLERSRFAGR